MYDAGKIIPALLIFVLVATIPFWSNRVFGDPGAPPDMSDGTIATETKCVADADYMRREHMQLLVDWRDDVVRRDDRTFVAEDGRQFDKSLTGTCLSCHPDPEKHCFKCHDYTGVRKPDCWGCHVIPKEVR